MSGAIPPIPPPFGACSSNSGSPYANRVDTMPTTIDPINTITTKNVAQIIVDKNLPQLLDSRGGSHVINVPAFDKENFTSWKVRFLVFLDGLEPYLLKTLEYGPFVPMSSLSTTKIPLPKRQNQWLNAESHLANQDKRLKSIIISCLPNDVMKSIIKCKTAKEMWNDLILAHEGPSNTRDTKIVVLRLKFNAFKSLEGENLATLYGKYNYEEGPIDKIYELETQRFSVLASSLKSYISNTQFQNSDSDVKEDQRTNNEFMTDLNTEYQERALLANQKRFYKRFGKVGYARKPIDKTKKACFSCGKLAIFKKDCPLNKTSTPSYPSLNNSFNKFKTYTPPINQTSSHNTEDEGTTRIRVLMTIAEDEPSVGKADARSEDQIKNMVNKYNLLKQELSLHKSETCDKDTLDQLFSKQTPGNIVKALGGKGRRKENNPSKEVLFNKADVSTSESAPMITSDSEDDNDIQELLPPLSKLTGADPSGASKSPISLKIENLNEVRVKELRSDNRTEFKNHKLEELYDEKSISRNFSSLCTPEQNDGEAVNTACYTKNRSIIVKRHGKTAYDVFRGRSPNIRYFYVFGYLVHIHNHRVHSGKFNEKVDDGFFLGYSLVAKAFRVFNIRRQEMEEIVHVTFSEDDEAISQTNTKGDAINFNENRSFIDDDFIEPRTKDTQCFVNIEYFPYISAYENITSTVFPTLQNSVTYEEPPEFTIAGDLLVIHEPDHVESADILGTKWIWKKMNEKAVVTKNKARLVAQGYNQQEWIDYEETFAPVARLEAIRIFLAYAAYMGFVVYHIDVKSVLLNGKISDEVYVQQPPGFKSSEFPNYVCKLDKALYELKQAPRPCFLSNCNICTALTKEPSAMYVEYLKDFWYTAEVDDVAKDISFSLSRFENQLSFTRFDFLTAIGLTDSKTAVPLPPKGTVRAGLATLGLVDKDKPSLTSTELVNSSPLKLKYFSLIWKIFMQYIVKCLGGMQESHDQMNLSQQTIAYCLIFGIEINIEDIIFKDLINKLQNGKKNREINVCYTRYVSLVLDQLLSENYHDESLTVLKPHHILAASFLTPSASEVSLTSRMLKAAKVSKEPDESLILSFEEVNAEESADKS
nr:hypothetical protein [Tanacetum cinerariifolium]